MLQRELERRLIWQLAVERELSGFPEITATEPDAFLQAESARRGFLPIAWLGTCYEQHQAELIDQERERAKRKSAGVYYTPPEVVRHLCRATLRPEHRFVIDPACGCGAFLLEAVSQRRSADGIYGVDIDLRAVELARMGLFFAAAEFHQDRDELWQTLQENVVCGDALAPQLPVPQPADGFDAVLSNPPYINIRLLTQQQGRAAREALSQRYATARGNFDLYVLFLERAFQLLGRGGRCGMIVPNKLATLDYAAACRELLLRETSLEVIGDLSNCKVFRQAGVYPYVLVWSKEPPAEDHRCEVFAVNDVTQLDQPELSTTKQRQTSWSAHAGINLHPTLAVEDRVPTVPLGEFAWLESGTTGFHAEEVAQALREQEEVTAAEGRCFPFLVSRNIDRYGVTLGRTRFAGQTWNLPVLPEASGALSDGKRRLYAGRKIVLAGLSRELEAAHDPGGFALGVQTFAIVLPADADDELWWYLLGLLNSRLLSHLFRTRFAAKRLAGGYLAMNKGQLARLPIQIVAEDDGVAKNLKQQIAAAAKISTEQGSSAERDAQINACVEQLYHVQPNELDVLD